MNYRYYFLLNFRELNSAFAFFFLDNYGFRFSFSFVTINLNCSSFESYWFYGLKLLEVSSESGYPAGNHLFKVNNRNTTTMWNMFKVNNKDIRTTPVIKMILNLETMWHHMHCHSLVDWNSFIAYGSLDRSSLVSGISTLFTVSVSPTEPSSSTP